MGAHFDRFAGKCHDAAQKVSSANDIIQPQLSPGFVQSVQVKTNERMAAATSTLMQVEKTAHLMDKYNERFPALAGESPPAHNPNKAMFFGFVLILIAAESFANSRLFAEADDFGLVGGALLAVLVSLINVLPVLFAGILAVKSRGNIDFPSWVWRAICVFAVLYAIAVNIVIWVLRNNKIMEANGTVDQSQSIILFIVGMVIAGLAFHKGWGFPDLYAKFRECKKQLEINKNRYKSEILTPISDAKERGLAAQNELVKAVAQLQKSVNEWRLHSPLIAYEAVREVGHVWQKYHHVYAPLRQGRVQELPDINDPEIAQKMGVHIQDVWENFAARAQEDAKSMNTKAEDDTLPRLEAVRERLLSLEEEFVAVITAKINNATP